MSLLPKNKTELQLLEFLFSGGVYFWVGYGAFALLWSGIGWSLWWAAVTSNFIGWIFNFLMQRYWVFNNRSLAQHQTEVTWRYIFITAVNFVLNYLILLGLRNEFHITPYVGQFVSSIFFTGWNYFWYRFWVFPSSFPSGKPRLSLSRLFLHIPHGHKSFGVSHVR